MGHSLFFIGSSRKVGEANKGLGEAPKSCTRKGHESATNSIAKRGQGGTSSLFVCPLQGQGTASLVGFGATPQLFRVKPTQRKKSTRRRQRSVPASNFARPQTRPQAALPPRFREAPVFLLRLVFEKRRASLSTCSAFDLSLADYLTSSQSTISPVKMSRI